MQYPLFPSKSSRLFAASLLIAGLAGCAGAHRTATAGMGPASLAPDDAPMHNNRNAQYTMVDATPRLVPRPTAEDAANAQPCEDRALSVSEIAANVNGNYRSVKLGFLNRGAAACRLGGYPQIALLGSDGKMGSIAIEKATASTISALMSEAPTPASVSDSASETSPEVVLMPHASAAFQIVWQSGPECPEISRIEVTAPGRMHAYPIAHPLTVCSGRIQITALQQDDGGA